MSAPLISVGIVFDAEGGQYMGVEELLKVAKEFSNIEQ